MSDHDIASFINCANFLDSNLALEASSKYIANKIYLDLKKDSNIIKKSINKFNMFSE